MSLTYSASVSAETNKVSVRLPKGEVTHGPLCLGNTPPMKSCSNDCKRYPQRSQLAETSQGTYNERQCDMRRHMVGRLRCAIS